MKKENWALLFASFIFHQQWTQLTSSFSWNTVSCLPWLDTYTLHTFLVFILYFSVFLTGSPSSDLSMLGARGLVTNLHIPVHTPSAAEFQMPPVCQHLLSLCLQLWTSTTHTLHPPASLTLPLKRLVAISNSTSVWATTSFALGHREQELSNCPPCFYSSFLTTHFSHRSRKWADKLVTLTSFLCLKLSNGILCAPRLIFHLAQKVLCDHTAIGCDLCCAVTPSPPTSHTPAHRPLHTSDMPGLQICTS